MHFFKQIGLYSKALTWVLIVNVAYWVPAQGVVHNFITGSSWDIGTNWDTSVVPNSSADEAVFGTGSPIVSVSGTKNIGRIQFNVNTTLSGSLINLHGIFTGPYEAIRVADGVTATINQTVSLQSTNSSTLGFYTGVGSTLNMTTSSIAGAGMSLSLYGSGTVNLGSDTKDFGGSGSALNIFGGTVIVGSNAALGHIDNQINFFGGNMTLTSGFLTLRTFNIASGNNTISLTGFGNQLLLSSLTGSGNLTFEGNNQFTALTIGGTQSTFTGNLTVQNGSLNLLNSSSGGHAFFTGINSITITNGTMNLTTNNQFNSGANIILNNSTLGAGTHTATINNLTMTGSTITGTGTLALNNITTLASNTTSSISTNINRPLSSTILSIADGSAAVDLNISGVISGSGTINQTGPGTLTLGAINTFSGSYSISQGTLNLDGTLNNISSLSLTNGSSLYIFAADRISNAASLSVTDSTVYLNANDSVFLVSLVGGTITGSGTLTPGTQISSNVSSTTSTISTNIFMPTGNGFIVEDGAANIDLNVTGVISGSNSLIKWSGGTMAVSGNNTYTGDTAIASGTLLVNSNSPNGASGALGNSTSTVALQQYGVMTGTLADIKLLIGTSGVTIGRNIFAGSTFNGETITIGSNITSGTATFSGDIQLARPQTYLQASTGGTTVFSGNIFSTSGGGLIIATGGGTVTLSGNNSGVTGIYIDTNTTVQVSASNNLGVASNGIRFTGTGGTLQTTASFTETSPRFFYLDNSGTIDTVGVSTVTTLHPDAQIIGAGNLTKTGAGTLVMGTNNLYTGNTIINGGTLAISTDAGLGTSTGSVTFNNLATLRTTASISNNRTMSLTGTGGTIETQGSGNTFTHTGSITGTNLVKLGAGTLTMTGSTANTYTGTTTVNAGTLVLDKSSGNAIATGAGAITVNTSGTLNLAASNQIGDNVDLILNGGTLSFSGSASSEVLGNLSLTEDSVIDFGGRDMVLTFAGIGTFTPGKRLTILNWQGLQAGGGLDRIQFMNTSGLTQTVMDQIYFQYNNTPAWGNAANIIGVNPSEVTPSPEPSTIVSGVIIIVIAGFFEYFRRRTKNQR